MGDNPYTIQPVRKTSTGIYWVLGSVSFLLIVMVVLATFFYAPARSFISKKLPASEEPTGMITLKAEVPQASFEALNYEFYKDFALYKTGILKPSIIETISGLPNASNYSLKILGEGYYTNSSDCILNSECLASTSRIGIVYFGVNQLKPDYHRATLLLEGGIVQSLTFCYSWHNLVSINMSLPETEVPADKLNIYDKCFKSSSTITSGIYDYDISIKNTDEYQPDRSYTLNIFEQCSIQPCLGESRLVVRP